MLFGRPNLEKHRAAQQALQRERAVARARRIAHQRPGPVSGRATMDGGTREAVPKECAVESEAYRRLVAALNGLSK